jgi:glycosyltransferase involved in cell wall biosynthesis
VAFCSAGLLDGKKWCSLSKKKLLLMTDWYEPGFKAGGPIQSCVNFVKAMYEEFEILVLTSDRDLGEKEPYPGIHTNRWTQRQPGVLVYYANTSALNAKKITDLLEQINPDFIYLNSMYSYNFSVVPLLFSWKKKISAQIVLAPRGMLQEGAMQFKTMKKKLFIRALNFMRVPGKIRFHATDEQEKKDILHYFPGAKSVDEISNFSAPLPLELKIIDKVPGILKMVYLSRIIPKKNILFFLGLLNQMPEDIPIQFDIYGEVEDIDYWEKAKQIIGSFRANIKTNIYEAVPHAEVNAVLESNHIFVLPSKGENFGHAIFESWSAGRPCLISDKTPWHQLSKELTGWDLPLENERLWLNAIIEAAYWDQSSFDSWCRASREFAERHVGQFNLKAEYVRMFA